MRVIARLLKRLILGLILALGALSALAYLATPLMSGFRDTLESTLATRLGVPVSIGSLEPRWHTLGPLLRLQDVTLGSGEHPLRLQEALLDLYLPGLWDHSGSGPLRLTLRGVRLRVVRDPAGDIRVIGLPRAGGDAAAPTRLGVTARVRLQQAEIVWEDQRTGRPPLVIAPVDLDLIGGPDGVRGSARLTSPYGQLQLAAELSGDLSGNSWSGWTRMRAIGLDLAALLGDYLPAHYRLSGLVLDGDLIGRWRDARPAMLRGRIDARDLRFAGTEEVQFRQLGANLAFARQPQGWRLQLDQLTIDRGGRRWPPGTIAAELSQTTDGQFEVRAGADFLRVEDLLAVLMVRTPWAELAPVVHGVDPHGDLHDVQLAVDFGPEHVDWQAAARFAGVQIRHAGKTPGIDKLSGTLRARPDHVQIQLDARDLTLEDGERLRAPLQLTRLQGQVDWLRNPEGGWSLRSDQLLLDTPFIQTRSRLGLTLVPERSPTLDLQVDFGGADASRAANYYPVGIMRPQLVEWLDRAIVSGQLTGGTAILHGPLADFPFDKDHTGRFEVVFDVHDLTLDYREGWPPLEQIDANVRFHGNALDIAVAQARIYDSKVGPTSARFEQLWPASPVEIRGRVTGPLADELRLLTESPLRKDFGNFVAGLRANGAARLDLDFAVPVRHEGEYRLAGQLQFLGSRLELVDWQLPLDDIRGTLAFDLHALRAQGIRARGLDSDLAIDVTPDAGGGSRVAARGRLDVPAIQSRLPKLPLQFASGSSDFQVTVDIPGVHAGADTPAWLTVSSDLRGIAVDLPPPFGKPAAGARRLQVRMPVSGGDNALDVTYQDVVDATLSQDLSRGEIQLGGAPAALPQTAGVRVRGKLTHLNLDDWLPAVRSLAGDATGSPPPLDVDLHIGQLRLGALALDDLTLTLKRDTGGWRGHVEAPRAVGDFTVPDDFANTPLRLDLEHLKLEPEFAEEATPDESPGDAARMDPRDWPALALHCKQLVIHQADLGQLSLKATRRDNGLTIDQLNLNGGLGRLEAKGSWTVLATGARTQLAGELTTPKLGRLLQDLGYAQQIKDGAAEFRFDVAWPGDPALIGDRRFDGKVDLTVRKGRLLDIEPGVSRVFGLLNFNALQRRLRLDFSDLFKKGLSFDRISGDFTLDEGDAYTNDLVIDGPSGKIEIAGRTGLVTHTFDQLVTVTPRLDATLPVAGAIAGGPLAGLAVLVAQQLMGEQVDRINRFQYSVTGPWDDPQINQLASGGSLSKLLRPFAGGDAAGQDTPDAADTMPPPATADSTGEASEAIPTTPERSEATTPAPSTAAPETPASAPAEAEAPEQPDNGSALGRLLKKLKPQGTGREILESTD